LPYRAAQGTPVTSRASSYSYDGGQYLQAKRAQVKSDSLCITLMRCKRIEVHYRRMEIRHGVEYSPEALLLSYNESDLTRARFACKY